MIKKFILAILFTLVLSGNAYSLNIKCFDHQKIKIASKSTLDSGIYIEYGSLDIILDNSGSVHITEYFTRMAYGDVFGYSETNDPSGFQKKVAAISDKEERKKFSLSHQRNMNPLIKDINHGTKD